MTTLEIRARYAHIYGPRPKFLGARRWDRQFRAWARGYLQGRAEGFARTESKQ